MFLDDFAADVEAEALAARFERSVLDAKMTLEDVVQVRLRYALARVFHADGYITIARVGH